LAERALPGRVERAARRLPMSPSGARAVHRYLLGDAAVASTVPLAGLAAARTANAEPALLVAAQDEPAAPPVVANWSHEWKDDDGQVVMAVARHEAGYLLRLPESCDFVISSDARTIEARPHTALAPELLEHLLVDQVLPRCLGHQGRLVVHSAGVVFEHGIALFVADSGRGKSTLAGLHLRAGLQVLSDDCLVLRGTPDGVRALPTYPSLRLRSDSFDALFTTTAEPNRTGVAADADANAKTKIPVLAAQLSSATRRVIALYFLADPVQAQSAIRFTPLAGAAACSRLMQQCFQLDLLAHAQATSLMRQASDVVSRVPAFALDYPREFQRSAELVERIAQHVAALERQAR